MFSTLLISLHDSGTFGHRCISSSLKRGGFLVSNIFFRKNSKYQDAQPLTPIELTTLTDLAKNLNPDLIGINVHSSFGHDFARTAISHLKQRLDVPIILGGVHPTLMPIYCLKSTDADYVCIGEGEDSIVEMCQRMQSGKTLHDIPGVMSKAMLTYTPREPPKDLDNLPFQDVGHDSKYSILSNGSIVEGDPMLAKYSYPTKCSRGCPFGCSFCSVNQLRSLHQRGKFYRLRSVEYIIEEICQFMKMNPNCNHVRFWDDTFPFNSQWIHSFSALYKRKVGIPFEIYLNPDTTKENNITALKQAGLYRIVMGIESASDKTRRAVFRRTESEDDILHADQILSKHGIKKVYDFILDHPWESPTELEDTLKLVTQLKKPFNLNMHSLALLPETELSNRAIEEGFVGSQEEVVDLMTSDVLSSSRKIQWIRGIPPQSDLDRSYWITLIMLAGHSDIPEWAVKFLASRRMLRRYPLLLTDVRMNEAWTVFDRESRILKPLRSIYARHLVLQQLLKKRFRLKRFVKILVERLTRVEHLTYFLLSICLRFVVKFPKVMLTR